MSDDNWVARPETVLEAIKAERAKHQLKLNRGRKEMFPQAEWDALRHRVVSKLNDVLMEQRIG